MTRYLFRGCVFVEVGGGVEMAKAGYCGRVEGLQCWGVVLVFTGCGGGRVE